MKKNLWKIIVFMFENVPNVGFWVGVIVILHEWYSLQHLLIRAAFIIIPLISIFVALRKAFIDIKSQILKISAESGLVEKKSSSSETHMRRMIKNVPSEKSLKAVHRYALNYAKSWASDGALMDITYYLELDQNKIDKRAQIFIRSQLRNEILTIYLPTYSEGDENIEEKDLSNDSKYVVVPQIHSHAHWRKAIKIVIESASSDIEKSEVTELQIVSHTSSLSLDLSFKRQNREWNRMYKLEGKNLKEGTKTIHDFN